MATTSKWRVACTSLVLLVAQASDATASPAQIDDPAYLKPARLVGIDKGRLLNIYCIGSGSPTVVLEAGHGDGLYAAQHEQEVAGLVLVDPTNEHQAEGYNRVDQRPYDVWDRLNKQNFAESEKCVAAAKSGSLTKGTALYDSCAATEDPEFIERINHVLVAQSVTYGAQRASTWEQESTFYKSATQLAANAGNYGSKPVIVLTRGPDPVRKGQTQAQADAEVIDDLSRSTPPRFE